MSKGSRKAAKSAAARLCEWRGLDWYSSLICCFRLRERQIMSKGSRKAAKSAAARLCEWRGLNCYLSFLPRQSVSRLLQCIS
ncbi:MAG: hypothetical protein Q4C60_11630 [Eubacteriales bacterium]|nr:hypothetical protein [Eubacteriales bacterium]